MNKFFEQTKKAANKARQAGISNLNAASTALSHASGTSIKLTTAKTDEELKRLLLEEPILFSGSVWKRRGGLGKLASYSSAWESRHLQLRGKVLLYFDSDPTKALSSSNDPQELLRGYLDLAEERATVQATFGHSGAPSPFCLSIKVPVGLAQETKWKLCFDHHQTQMEWLTAISDVVIQYSVDMYNRALLDAANPSNHNGAGTAGSMDSSGHNFLRRPPVYEPGTRDFNSGNGTPKSRSNSFQLADSPHQLWMMDDYAVERKTTLTKEQQGKTKASVDTALQVMERLLAEERNQRSVAAQKLKALEIELDDALKVKDQSTEELAKMASEKKALETELAVRISTHDLGDGREQAVRDNVELRAQVDNLTTALETKTNEWEQSKEDVEQEKRLLEQQVAELQTKLVIAQSDTEEAIHKARHDANERLSAEVETVKSVTAERISALEKELETNKKEYQESIQALAASFQQSIGVSGPGVQNGNKRVNGESGTEDMHRSISNISENEEFEDCVES